MATITDRVYPEIICFGEVLWDIFPQGAKPGGAPMNVAYHLSQAGIPTSIISRTGNDDLGRSLRTLLEKWQVDTEHCGVDATLPTGTVIATLDEKKEAHYQIVEEVAWDYIQVTEQANALLPSSKALVYGSLASRNEVSRAALLQLLNHAPYKVFDVNLRAPFYSSAILRELLQAADLVKLNEAELRVILHLVGKPFVSEEHGISFLREIFDIGEVLLTKGSRGACYYVDKHYYEFPIVPVQVKDTVGSGDAFLAGFLAAKIHQAPPEEAMTNAIALSAFVTAREGACPAYTQEEFRTFKESAREVPLS